MQYKVLIVEDDPMVSMINEQYVNRNKAFHVVGKCKNGKSALEFLENSDVDLIVLDVYMPLMDGFETLRQIRKNKKSVDIIMVTAANDRDLSNLLPMTASAWRLINTFRTLMRSKMWTH